MPIATTHADHAAAEGHHHAVLATLIDMGADIARLLHAQAIAEAAAGEPVTDTAHAFDRVGRGVRRSILLDRRLHEGLSATERRTAARRRILRDVGDAIHRRAGGAAEADALNEELLDRLDSPELDEELGDRPVEAIIEEISRDLGLAAPPGADPWKRREPADVAALCAHAAAAPGTRQRGRLTLVPDAPPHRDSG